MRDYRGTLAGLVIGAFGGLYAALFGALIGFLIDLIRADLRVVRLTIRFLDTGEAPPRFPRPLALAGRLYGRLRPFGPLTGSDAANVPDSIVGALQPLLPDRFPRRAAERIIATATTHPHPDDECWSRWLASCTTTDERELVVRVVWEELGREGAAHAAREAMHDLARRAGLDDRFIAHEIVEHRSLDAEACRVLGVERDASPDEVRAAYRRLAAQFHPDTASGLSGEQRKATEEAFVRIQAAYEKLRRA